MPPSGSRPVLAWLAAAGLGVLAAAALFDPGWKVARRYGTDVLPGTHFLRGADAIWSWRAPARWDDAVVRAQLDALIDRGAVRSAR